VDITRSQRKRVSQEQLEKGSGERNVDSELQVQPEEDGGSSTRESWMETRGLCTVIPYTESDKTW